LPGLPIWDTELLTFIKSAEHAYEKIYVLVGDFRFGNEIFSAPHKKRHLGIKKENINKQNDEELLNKSLDALDEIYKIKNVQFIFWDLYVREFINRRSGHYTENNIYKHPLWNYSFFQNRYSIRTVELNLLDNLNIDLLFVDSSVHPSILGYCFLYNLFGNQSVINSFLSSLKLKGDIDKDLYYATPSTIIGNGSFFRTVQLHITKGIISAFPNILLSRADDALFAKRKETRTLFFFSESHNEDGVQKCLEYVRNSNWAKKIHVELLFLKEKLSHEAMVEITDGRPSFLFIYSILHSTLNEKPIKEMDVEYYKERLSNLFRKNCLHLT